MKKISGSSALLMQYFKNGFVVVTRNRKYRLNRIKVVMFQLIIKTARENPTSPVLIKLTLPRYSGARYNESTPYVFINEPFTAPKRITQNVTSTWYFLKCSNASCTGKEYNID